MTEPKIVQQSPFQPQLKIPATYMRGGTSKGMFFNLQVKTKESDFENFLALVPPAYEVYLKDVKTSGSAIIGGNFKGCVCMGQEYRVPRLVKCVLKTVQPSQ